MADKLHPMAQTNDMKQAPTHAPSVKQQQAEKFARILAATGSADPNAGEGLIRAFRQQQNAKDAANATPGSDADSEQGPTTPHADGAPAAAAAGGAEQSSGSMISFRPSDPILLDAYRMLALSPTAPPSMHRPQWSSYDYHVLEKLYTGYASKVYKAVCKRSNQVVVLKSYQLSAICELYQHQIFREVALHASLKHEHVVQLSGAFQEGDFVVLVQEYAAGGNLFDLLQKYGGRLNEHVTVQMVLEPFLRVLQYLHTRGIIHRDIKPENILFTSDMTLKLADFGLAIDLRRERAVTRAGTLDYMAPEVLNCPYKNKPEENKEKAHLHYGGTVDSWAVGVLAYELLVGCPPFYDSTRDRVEQRIRSQAPVFPRTMSEAARSFITCALTKDAAQRPSVLQLLNHPWINTFRSRRSMRSIGLNGGGAASPATAALVGGASPVIAANAAAAASIAAAVSAGQADAAAAAAAPAPAAAAAISPTPSVAQPVTPGSTAASPTSATSFFSAEVGAVKGSSSSNKLAVPGAASRAPAAAAAGQQQQQQQARVPSLKLSSGKPGGSSSSSTSPASGVQVSLLRTPRVGLRTPRGLSTMPPSPGTAHRVAKPAAAPAPTAAPAPASSAAIEGEVQRLCPMVSAKSSPLMIADVREVRLGVAAMAGQQQHACHPVPAPLGTASSSSSSAAAIAARVSNDLAAAMAAQAAAAAAAAEQAAEATEAEVEAMRKHRKWLGLSKLWKDK